MPAPAVLLEDQLLHEIQQIPEEYRPQLLQIMREFRESVTLPSARESFREGLREALTGQTLPLSELWEGVERD